MSGMVLDSIILNFDRLQKLMFPINCDFLKISLKTFQSPVPIVTFRILIYTTEVLGPECWEVNVMIKITDWVSFVKFK